MRNKYRHGYMYKINNQSAQKPYMQPFHSTYGCFTWNMVTNDRVTLEIFFFENVNGRRRRTIAILSPNLSLPLRWAKTDQTAFTKKKWKRTTCECILIELRRSILYSLCGSRRGGGGRGSGPPWKSQKCRAPFRTVPHPLKIHKATKPAFNVGPSSAR